MKTLTNDDIFDDGLERVSEAALFLGMSRSHVYRLLRDGILPSVKIGKSRRVPIRAVRNLARNNVVSVPERMDTES